MPDISAPNDQNTAFSKAFHRLWTRSGYDAFDLIHFSEGLESDFSAPENWNDTARDILADDATAQVPDEIKAIEENTIPSWLWQHAGQTAATHRENSVHAILHRVVGGAAYKAWKLDLFNNETEARCFYDELCYGLAQRFIAIEPSLLAQAGTQWAYGSEETKYTAAGSNNPAALHLTNKCIDAIVGGQRNQITRQLSAHKKSDAPQSITFADIADDWGDDASHTQASAALDLLRFRHNDGSINIEAIQQAVRMLVTLLDLHDLPVRIGVANLAPLLMAFALPYDSDQARNLAGSITALITAEAFATSAHLAATRGISEAFSAKREGTMRNLRNHRRAVYGDHNDYEKLSVLPVALDVQKSPDLALLAAAQRSWDDALASAKEHGLRHTHVTAQNFTPALRGLMDCSAYGVESLSTLKDYQTGTILAVASEALDHLHYSAEATRAIQKHIAGHGDLAHAPKINHKNLKALGFDTTAIEAAESYMPHVRDIRLALTPWIIGEDFCQKKFGLTPDNLDDFSFDLLAHLGFSDADILDANAYAYGHSDLTGCTALHSPHTAIFAAKYSISSDAHIRMAAMAQSFTSCAIQVDIDVPAHDTNGREKSVLAAWRLGLRAMSLNLVTDSTKTDVKARKSSLVSKALQTMPAPKLPQRQVKKIAGKSESIGANLLVRAKDRPQKSRS